jgi:5'-nucleotidase / UDP-sugar diphosphatase
MIRRDFIHRLGLTSAWAPVGLLTAAGTEAGGDLGGLVAGVQPIPTAARNASPQIRTISLIHTTDLHGHILPTETYEGLGPVGGLARCATLIRAWRAENPHSLLLDIGDLYQGTDVAHRTQGHAMVKQLNALRYDAWVLGNHDFDWGRDILESAIAKAEMPVLGANLIFSGKPAGAQEKGSPLAKLVPHMIKEIGGLKIGLIGVCTPGLSSWLHPRLLRDIRSLDPLAPARAAAADLKAAGAHAIILCGHMGFKARTYFSDDHANRILDLTKECPDIDAFIGAHTHKDIPSGTANKVLYTQAGYYGIYLGRLDLAFHSESGKLLDVRAMTVCMDNRFAEDAAVLALAKDDLAASEIALAKPVGQFSRALTARSKPGQPSDQQLLIGAAIREACAKKGQPVVGVYHGDFGDDEIPAGEKTIGDLWKIIPYENFLVTAELSRAEMITVLNEGFTIERSVRNLIGYVVQIEDGPEGHAVVKLITDPNGRPVPADHRFKVAFNTFDGQSGGQRLLKLREILASPKTASQFVDIQTRDALVEYIVSHKII